MTRYYATRPEGSVHDLGECANAVEIADAVLRAGIPYSSSTQIRTEENLRILQTNLNTVLPLTAVLDNTGGCLHELYSATPFTLLVLDYDKDEIIEQQREEGTLFKNAVGEDVAMRCISAEANELDARVVAHYQQQWDSQP